MKPSLSLLLSAVALTTLSGCADFDHVEFVLDGTPPVAAVVTFEEIRLPEGVAVLTTARPMTDSGVMSRDTVIELKPTDERIFGVAWALPHELDEETERASWSFVLFGAAPGSTTVNVRIDGTYEAEIPALIEPQPQ